MCEQRAERELAGLGDPLAGEWREWSGTAFHIRRRLTVAEAEAVGPVRDIRGTAEAAERVARLPRRLLRAVPPSVLAEEVGRLP
jgi:hypothetical protein